MKYDATALDAELKAAGLVISGCTSTGRIDWLDPPTPEEQATADAVLAAHDPDSARQKRYDDSVGSIIAADDTSITCGSVATLLKSARFFWSSAMYVRVIIEVISGSGSLILKLNGVQAQIKTAPFPGVVRLSGSVPNSDVVEMQLWGTDVAIGLVEIGYTSSPPPPLPTGHTATFDDWGAPLVEGTPTTIS